MLPNYHQDQQQFNNCLNINHILGGNAEQASTIDILSAMGYTADTPDICFKKLIQNVLEHFGLPTKTNSNINTVYGYKSSDSKLIKSIFRICVASKQMVNEIDESIMLSLWNRIAEICDKNQENDQRINLFCRAITQQKENRQFCPTIKTLDELVITQQKRDYLDNQIKNEYQYLVNKANQYPDNLIVQRKISAYAALILQIQNSNPNTTLSEIFEKESIFLKACLSDKINPNEIYTIESALNEKIDDLAESFDKVNFLLEEIRNALTICNPRTVLSSANTSLIYASDIPINYFFEKNCLIFAELITYQQDDSNIHLNSDNKEELSELCNDIFYLGSRSLNHERNHQLIINRIKEILFKQEHQFKKNNFSFDNTENSQSKFEKELDKNNSKYYYMAMLRNILKRQDIDPIHINKSTLFSVISQNNQYGSGQRIKRGSFLCTSKADNNSISFSKSIDIDGDNQFYLLPGKGENIIGSGRYGTVKRNIIKYTQEKDSNIKMESIWVKKGIKNQTREVVEEEIQAIHACAPELKPSKVFSKNDKNHRFFMKNAGEVNLAEIISGKKKIILNKEDILGILNDILNQAYHAQIDNSYIMYDIKPANIAYIKCEYDEQQKKNNYTKEINYY